MNIGVDFDGVIADTSVLKIHYVKKYFNIKIGIENSSREKLSEIIGGDNYNKMVKETYSSREMNIVHAVKGAPAALKKLSKNNKIIIITSRTSTEALAAKKWLKKNKIKYDLIINTSNKSKSEMCKRYAVDALIEDELAQLLKIKYPKTKKILLQKPYNLDKKVDKEIKVCLDWQNILKVLE